MDNKNNTKKKVIAVILVVLALAIALLFILKGCQKEELVVHTHSYKINEEGTWICKDDNDILSNTDKPYVAILENNEPKDIMAIDSLSKTKINLGNGTIYKDGNNIYYSGNNAQTVIIKTQKVDDKQVNKDNLVINAPNDTVYHYGSSTVISLDAVATNSFHEYGKVDLITLTKARVVLENPSDVKEIYLDINDTNYSYETTIIALKENVELPRLTRDAVDLEEGEVKTLAIVQKLKDEVKTETNTETNEVIETVLEVQAADDDYVKIENVRKSNDELIIEAFLSPNADENDKTLTDNQSTSTVTLEEAKEGSSHPASHNTFVPKEEKVIEVVKPTETKVEEPKQEETKPVVTPTKKEETKPEVTPTEEDTPSTPSHSHSYGNWYDLDDTYHAKKCSCGDTVKEAHEYDENGVCKKCEHQNKIYVAQVESTKYEDALTAFKDAKLDNKTVTILANCSVFAEDLPDDVDFDLNGKTLSKAFYKKVTSADGENIFVDFWDSWNMQGMKDKNGNECPQYILVSDETLYRDLGVSESNSEAWVSAKYIVENHASYCSFYEIANEPVSVFDGNTTAFKYFANGNGSQAKPYIIENVEQFKNMCKLSDYQFVDEDEKILNEKKTNKIYYINVTASSLDFTSVSRAIWQLTAASKFIEASGFNVNIDFNDCEISGKDLTFGSVGKYMAESLYDSNFGIFYPAGYYLGDVYDRAYSVIIKNAKFINCGVSAENGVSLTLDNCTFNYDGNDNIAIRANQDSDSTVSQVNINVKNCEFNNAQVKIMGNSRDSGYNVNVLVDGCSFTGTMAKSNAPIEFTSYIYGNSTIKDTTINTISGFGIKSDTNTSYTGGNKNNITINGVSITLNPKTTGSYWQQFNPTKPISATVSTELTFSGENTYKFGEISVDLDGNAIE